MAQVTVYLDDDVLALLNSATDGAGISKSKWIADAIRMRARKEWPASVVALAGAWPDLPTVEEIRALYVADAKREPL